MKKTFSILIALALVLGFSLVAVPAGANGDPPNTVASSTMIFKGDLTAAGGGVYTGTIPMVNEQAESLGDGIAGFDVYAEDGATAYVQGLGTWTIANHDAYGAPGPWGAWWDPDCADWDQYSLELTADHWYLRYTATGESPMSGVMYWYGGGTGYAAETDPGTVRNDDGSNPTDPLNRDATRYASGSAQEWGWDCGWGEERIPLELPGFAVEVTSGGSYIVTLTPAAATVATSTGTGTASFNPSAGAIEGLTAVTTPPSAPVVLPHGLFSFKVTGLAPGQEVTLTIKLPGRVPVGTIWWKYHAGKWYSLLIGDDDGDNTITITLTDGVFPGDADSIAGQITDPGGPGYTGVGWETYPISKVRVLLPWIALGVAIVAGAILLVLRRRRTQT